MQLKQVFFYKEYIREVSLVSLKQQWIIMMKISDMLSNVNLII